MEAVALPVHRPLRRLRARRAVAVDGDRGGGVAQRAGVRLADRLPADRRRAAATLRRLRGGADRRPDRARPAGRRRPPDLPALRAERRIGHDDRRTVPGGDRSPPGRPPPVGVLAVVAGGARTPRGVAAAGGGGSVAVARAAGGARLDPGGG